MTQRFEPRGPLALDPQAFGMVIMGPPPPPVVTMRGDVAIVDIRGPLQHHFDPFCDSYDAIKGRIAEALAKSPRAIVMSIDSPGGAVSGCFDTVREIRAMVAASGVSIRAHVTGHACSAAYALACAAEKIVIGQTAIVGSIGIIDALVDATAQDAAAGVRFQLVGSTRGKGDGNPHASISAEAIAESRGRVEKLAEVFFGLVAESRGLSADFVRGLEARQACGAEAQALRLADEVKTLEQLIASLSAEASNSEEVMDDYKDAIAKLRTAAEGDDENAKMARKMLAAMEDEPEEKKDDEEEGKAEGDEEKPEEKKDDEEEGKAKALVALSTRVNALEKSGAAAQAVIERQAREALRSARPDVSASVHDALSMLSVGDYEKALGKIPRPAAPAPAATATVTGTRGAHQGGVSQLPNDRAAEIARVMGVGAQAQYGVVQEENRMVFGAPLPATPVTGKGA
jgi:ClpP class serine protease